MRHSKERIFRSDYIRELTKTEPQAEFIPILSVPARRDCASNPALFVAQWFKRIKALRFILTCIIFLTAIPVTLHADSFDAYRSAGSFLVPEGTGSFDILADGRLLLLVNDEVWIEDETASRTFSLHGNLVGADIPSFGAAFIRVSPDGTKIAVGNNGGSGFVDFKVGIVDFNTLSGTWFDANHFVARWMDNSNLMIAASDFTNGSSVTVMDITSSDPNNPTNITVLQNIGGASGGIAIDAAGRLFTGNGFTSIGPSDSGTVKAFDNTAWTAALAGGSAPNFEDDGTFIIDILGASPIGFDHEGNMFVGGGGIAPDSDSIALIRASAIADALAGMGPIDTFDPTNVRRLDPIPANDFNFFSADYNPITGELYVRDFGDTTIYIYRDRMGVPMATPFATEVVRFDPAPGQFVNDEQFNDPNRALGEPIGGGIDAGGNTSIVSLGAFGGSITLGFDHTVMDDLLNPLGMDAIVFSNAFWPAANPSDHWAEPATIEISLDENNNGIADDPWYLIPGSHIPNPAEQWLVITWDDNISNDAYPPPFKFWIPPGFSGTWTTTAYELPAELFSEIIIRNPSDDPLIEGIFGYAEYTPTLLLGDMNVDNIIDQPEMLPENFYTVPDDPFYVGISPGSGGGDAFDIAWAIHPITGIPANLTGFDFIRLTTAVYVDVVMVGPTGEKSSEIDAVADVKPDPFGDYDDDGDIDLQDVAELQICFGIEYPMGMGCDRFDREPDQTISITDATQMFQRITGPR